MPVDAVVVTVAGVFGAVFGSFLNVCILRLPKDESLVHPRSRCPGCGYQLAWFDNLPVLSWTLLRGRCRRCRAPISVQYPLIELTVGVLWAAAAWHYGLDRTALAAAVFGTILLGIAVTDARHYLIPDEYTMVGLPLGLLFAALGGWPSLMEAAIGAAFGFGLLYLVAWAGQRAFGKEAMGGGDIKMMAMVGAYVGWQGVLLTVFGGALLGTVIFVPLSLRKQQLVPFGVFLAAAAALTFVFGEAAWNWYLAVALGSS